MPHTVMLVDDDPQLTHVVSMFFELEGFMVMTAKTSAEALQELSETKPDVILLDLMMPDMDGAELCKRIRSDKRLTNIPIAVFTAAEMRESELQEAGADRFIVKPYSLDGLRATIDELIESRAAKPRRT
jgi:DNA-binding response OmpR family regulator